MRKWVKGVGAICMIGLFLSGCGGTGESAVLMVQGNLKADEVNLNSKLAGRIETVLIEEGQEVRQGEVLILLDSRSLAATEQQAEAAWQGAVEQQKAAEAALTAAQAQYAKALNGTRSQDLAQSQAAYELAVKTYERIQKLHETGAVSDADLDQAAAQYAMVQQTYEMAQEGARTEDISMAAAAVTQAAATVEAAKSQVLRAAGAVAEVGAYVEDATIKAPLDGRVTAVNVSAGELISTGMPLATISSLETPWVELKVRETDLAQVSLKQTVQVRIPAYPDQVFKGTVAKVNQKPDFATKRSTSNNGDFDVLAFGVKVIIEDVDHEVFPGMTVFVTFSEPQEAIEAEHE
jgi:HlyD family secretion protein